MTRYPFRPVEFVAAEPSTLALARRLRVHVRQVYRWRDSGVTEGQADRLACVLGYHPLVLWPDWMPNGQKCEGCDVMFAPTRKGHRFCSQRCGWRVQQRRRRQSDPEWAEKQRLLSRSYYAECRDYVKARELRLYHRKRGAA